jgi:glycosyltransferase involved in cell wall biosynthesis
MGINRSALHNLAYRLINPCFDQVQTVSAAVRRETIRADALDPDRVVTVPNGIDVRSLASANGSHALFRSVGLENRSPRIVTVGHLRPVKGADVFLRAASEVIVRYPNAVFLHIGGMNANGYGGEIQSLVRDLRLEHHVRFFPSQNAVNVWSLSKACDIFCLLSRSEGMSNALLEAMACGLPCVATAVGGNPEVIEDGSTGYLVPNEDYHAAASRILELLAHPESAARMGQRARESITATFSARRTADMVIREYDRLLAAARPRGSAPHTS